MMPPTLAKYEMKGSVVLVTGACGLLGPMHCEALLEVGATVVMVDKDVEALDRLIVRFSEVFPSHVYSFACDITDETQVRDLVDYLQAIDININVLVNNAAINPKMDNIQGDVSHFRPIEDFDAAAFFSEVDVSLVGSVFLVKHLWECFKASGKRGNVVNIASDLAVIAPDHRIYQENIDTAAKIPMYKPLGYSLVKHGMIGLTKYLATYQPNIVRSNALAFGGVYAGQNPQLVANLEYRIPMGRMAKQDEYKAALVFLCSEASEYMTGQTLVIDGGRSAW